MAASWPIVTSDDCSIVRMSEWSCWRAAETAELELELEEPYDELLELEEVEQSTRRGRGARTCRPCVLNRMRVVEASLNSPGGRR